MAWYFWTGIWVAVLMLVMLWRFLYRAFPKVSFVDLITLPTWLAFYEIEGTVFYRSDVLAAVVLYLLLAGVWAFLVIGRNSTTALRFIHIAWRTSGLVATVLCVITIIWAIVA
ncbi:hypothetical protein H7198_02075 [Fructobacillus sp. CRL 2054]|uniref:hypothetical protein n=1 Tax=Fructobacillus sp. CRL 2054 TaxID=2763007 RepID=UPI002378B41C|nr:hypothetical protein [Fructobacillus sp. CRL 2054]MDD9138401.1 hypothetical protein [Fructobacillus sp. CRL 2054]